jgi:hypothetical protein
MTKTWQMLLPRLSVLFNPRRCWLKNRRVPCNKYLQICLGLCTVFVYEIAVYTGIFIVSGYCRQNYVFQHMWLISLVECRRISCLVRLFWKTQLLILGHVACLIVSSSLPYFACIIPLIQLSLVACFVGRVTWIIVLIVTDIGIQTA